MAGGPGGIYVEPPIAASRTLRKRCTNNVVVLSLPLTTLFVGKPLVVNGFVSRPPGRLAGVKITRPPGRPRDRDTKPLTTHILVTVFFLLREYVNGFQLPRLMDCFLPSFSFGKVESQSISRALEGAWKLTIWYFRWSASD